MPSRYRADPDRAIFAAIGVQSTFASMRDVAGVTTFASILHGCHRELIQYQPQVSFERRNFMELIRESMRITLGILTLHQAPAD